MSGTLYLVATPIGNLEDITLRALRILREVTVIAAEDTRHTARLLHHHGIKTPTVSFHQHNTSARVSQLLRRLQNGESVAVVSDAGTPSVSDPGRELVEACIQAGVRVDPIPGPSAVLTALVASGFPTEPVTFLGFAPAKAGGRNKWLADVSTVDHTVVFFESPHRISKLLEAAVPILGDRPLCIARELTKLHQQFLYGTASDLLNTLSDPRGEFTVVVGPRPAESHFEGILLESDRLTKEFGQLTNNAGLSRREAIAQLAQKYGRSSREIYSGLEEAKRRVP